jgi:hypothetical protein
MAVTDVVYRTCGFECVVEATPLEDLGDIGATTPEFQTMSFPATSVIRGNNERARERSMIR